MVICDLRNKELQGTKTKTDFCCGSPEIIMDNEKVCKNCGSVHGYDVSNELVDFYENTEYRRRVFNRENIILIIYLKKMLPLGKILVVSVILHFFIKYW